MKSLIFCILIFFFLVALSYSKRCDVIVVGDRLFLKSYVKWNVLVKNEAIRKEEIKSIEIEQCVPRVFCLKITTDNASYLINESATGGVSPLNKMKKKIAQGLKMESFKVSLYELDVFLYLAVVFITISFFLKLGWCTLIDNKKVTPQSSRIGE